MTVWDLYGSMSKLIEAGHRDLPVMQDVAGDLVEAVKLGDVDAVGIWDPDVVEGKTGVRPDGDVVVLHG